VFDDLVRDGVALAASLLNDGGLMASVSHYPVTSRTDYGEPAFGSATTRRAVVSEGTQSVRNANGELETFSAKVVFLGVVTVTHGDKLVLPSGGWGLVRRIDRGIADGDNVGFTTTVYIGE